MAQKYTWDYEKKKKIVNPFARAKKRAEKANKNELSAQSFADKLKVELTEAEQVLKEALIENRINFEFQKVIAHHRFTYIADFYIHLKSGRKIVVECDGYYHFRQKQKNKDAIRDSRLQSIWGIKTLRFTNSDVLRKTKDVIFQILCYEPDRLTFQAP